jgi:dihydrofolate reductase
MRIELVVAMAENRVIGRDNALPWHIPEDLKRFKALTMGKPMIMGRRTFDSIGRVLPGRDSIVLSRSGDFGPDGLIVAASLDDALEKATARAEARRVDAIMVIGGARLFAETLPMADFIHLTRVHASPPGDTFFPALDETRWRETWRDAHPSGKDHSAFTFLRLERTGLPEPLGGTTDTNHPD